MYFIKFFPDRLTDKQAEETAKLLLNLCQTSLIGSTSFIVISEDKWFVIASIGTIMSIIFYMAAMTLLKNIKKV